MYWLLPLNVALDPPNLDCVVDTVDPAESIEVFLRMTSAAAATVKLAPTIEHRILIM